MFSSTLYVRQNQYMFSFTDCAFGFKEIIVKLGKKNHCQTQMLSLLVMNFIGSVPLFGGFIYLIFLRRELHSVTVDISSFPSGTIC